MKMKKTISALFGLILLGVSITVFLLLRSGEKLALSKDTKKVAFGAIDGPPQCAWEVKSPERVMAENQSQALLIEFTNPTDVECESTLSLRAPGFDLSPAKEEQTVKFRSGESGSLPWIVVPRKTGTYEITLTDMINTRVFGITVTNVLGLSAMQAKLFSLFGTIFGPMFTVPWWWDRLRKEKKTPKETQISQ